MGYSLLIIIAKAVQPQSNLQEKAQKWRLNINKKQSLPPSFPKRIDIHIFQFGRKAASKLIVCS